MSTKQSHSLGFITWMQMIGCVLVIIGHSYPFVTTVPGWAKELQLFIYDFHMPLFVWCSGYLIVAANQFEKYSFFAYTKRRAAHILLPYTVFSLIGIAPKILLSELLNDTLSFNLMQIVRAFFVPRENIWGHFWFLPMIFILGLIGYGLARITRKTSQGVLTVLLIVGAVGYFLPALTDWFALNDVVHYAFYLILGMICANFRISLQKQQLLVGILAFIMSVALFLLFPHKKVVSFMISLLMLFAVYIVSVYWDEKHAVDRNAIYAQTYSIFILSWPCQLVVEILLERFLKMPFAVIFPFMFVAGVAAPLFIIYIVALFEKKTKTTFISKTIGR